MKTPLRWAGSKKALLPTLRKYWDDGWKRYVEPFCGSACFFFDVEPQEALLGDINAELIGAYRAIRTDPGRVVEALKRLRPNEATYYRVRAIDPFTLSHVELAARFLFLNRYCFNGIYRTNLNGKFNVPYSHPKKPVKVEIEAILNAASLLRGASLMEGDFELVLNEVERDDFVYLDPPYAVASRRVFAEYHPNGFSEKDLKRLEQALIEIDRRGAKFVLSYADSAEGRRLAKNWNWKRIRARRNVAGFAGDRRSAYEVLASNMEVL